MHSEGYNTWSVCPSVCLSICLCLFSHYRLRGGLYVIPAASKLQGHENKKVIFLKQLRSRDMAWKQAKKPLCKAAYLDHCPLIRSMETSEGIKGYTMDTRESPQTATLAMLQRVCVACGGRDRAHWWRARVHVCAWRLHTAATCRPELRTSEILRGDFLGTTGKQVLWVSSFVLF